MRRAWNIPLCAAIGVHWGAFVLAWVCVPLPGHVDAGGDVQSIAVELVSSPESPALSDARDGQQSEQTAQYEATAEMLEALGVREGSSLPSVPLPIANEAAFSASNARTPAAIKTSSLDLAAASVRAMVSLAAERVREVEPLRDRARQAAATISSAMRDQWDSAQRVLNEIARMRANHQAAQSSAAQNNTGPPSSSAASGVETSVHGGTPQRDASEPARSEQLSAGVQALGASRISRAPSPAPGNAFPEYPVECRRLKQEGTVLVRVTIEPDGRVSQVSLAQSSGFDALDQAALAGVRSWRFVPAARDGVHVQCDAVLPVVFRLAR